MMMSFFMREGYYWRLSKCIRKGGEVMHINSISKIEEAAVFISMMNKDST